MAATNFTPIQLYFSTTASAVPTAANLAQGELAININDGKLYYEDSTGVVQVIATKGAGTIGGSTTQIQYNNAGALAGNAAMVFNSGTSTTTLTTLNLTNALGAIYGGTAQSTYTQGDVLYSSATNTLAKLSIGAVNYILASTGSVPQWVAPSSIAVLTATNLAGGLAGSVPYQSALDTTTFLPIGAADRVMTSTGSAPQWVTSLTGLTGVSTTTLTTSSTVTINGGTANGVAYLNGSKVLTTGSALTFDGTNLSVSSPSTATTFTLADNAGRLVVLKNSLGTGGTAEVGTTTNHDFYVRAGVSSGGANSLYLQAGGVTGYSLDYAGVSAWSVGGVEKLRLNATGLQVTNTLSGGTSGTAYSFSGSAPATSLTLDSSGNLGVGRAPTAAGTYKMLELDGSAGGYMRLYASGTLSGYFYSSAVESGIGSVTSAPFVFYTNNTERMRLDSSGNLGLGVTPSAWNSSSKAFQLGSSGTASLEEYAGIVTSVYQNAYRDSSAGHKYLTSTPASWYYQYNGTHNWLNAASGTAGNAISFTQAMTLDASGNLKVGTTSSANAHILETATSGVYSTQFISSTASSPYGSNIYFSGAAPNGTSNQFLYCNDSSALRMEVRSNGGIANYTANNVILSDRREKTNFAPATSYLDKICAIPVQTFNYIDQNLETDAGLTLGVVAQDVQEVAPELVTEGNWGTKENPKMRLEIYQTDLQYALMKALQELNAKFEAYKASHP